MSHPNPQYEPEHSYPSDNYKPVRKEFKGESPISKLKGLIGESQQIRKGNLSGKKKTVAKKMKNSNFHSPQHMAHSMRKGEPINVSRNKSIDSFKKMKSKKPYSGGYYGDNPPKNDKQAADWANEQDQYFGR